MRTVVLVGCGALGSHVLQFMRNLEVTFKLVDFDRIEQRNVQSQFHAKSGVGKNKVQALQQLMQFMWGKKVEGVPHKMTQDNVSKLLGGSDLVLDCLDNGEARRILQGLVREADIPCLHGALAADGSFGRVIWDQDFIIDDEDVEGAATCEEGDFLPWIALVSAYMSKSAQDFLSDNQQVGYNVHPGGAVRI